MSLSSLSSLEALSLTELVAIASSAPMESDIEAAGPPPSSVDEKARELLVTVHLRDVVDEAIAHRGSGVPLEALVQRGLRGLLQAARAFDPRVHGSFSCFSRAQIRAALREVVFPH